ncbi:MAG: 1-acyl-sn-glycerol-3-phosphate acyltransferase [Anaerolineae bacterium]
MLWSPVLIVARLLGWRPIGDIFDVPRCVAIGVPHTSNWDVVLFLWLACYNCRAPKWMVKDQWDYPVIGFFARLLGAVFIQRDKDLNIVDQAVAEFKRRERFCLVVTPEGTRKRAEYWKTGFYYIALNAQVPIAVAAVDYKHKRAGFTKIFVPTGNIEADLEVIREALKDAHGKFPQNAGPIRFKPKNEGAQSSLIQ